MAWWMQKNPTWSGILRPPKPNSSTVRQHWEILSIKVMNSIGYNPGRVQFTLETSLTYCQLCEPGSGSVCTGIEWLPTCTAYSQSTLEARKTRSNARNSQSVWVGWTNLQDHLEMLETVNVCSTTRTEPHSSSGICCSGSWLSCAPIDPHQSRSSSFISPVLLHIYSSHSVSFCQFIVVCLLVSAIIKFWTFLTQIHPWTPLCVVLGYSCLPLSYFKSPCCVQSFCPRPNSCECPCLLILFTFSRVPTLST